MFISMRRRGYEGTEQVHLADSLSYASPKDGKSQCAYSRTGPLTSMRQLGHFMMGTARAYGHSITLSGSYGSDGLPCNVPQEVYDRAMALPEWLHEAWNKGGGWNSCGNEAPAMRQWAIATFPTPRKHSLVYRCGLHVTPHR